MCRAGFATTLLDDTDPHGDHAAASVQVREPAEFFRRGRIVDRGGKDLLLAFVTCDVIGGLVARDHRRQDGGRRGTQPHFDRQLALIDQLQRLGDLMALVLRDRKGNRQVIVGRRHGSQARMIREGVFVLSPT